MEDKLVCYISALEDLPSVFYTDWLQDLAEKERLIPIDILHYTVGFRSGLSYCSKGEIYPTYRNTPELKYQTQNEVYLQALRTEPDDDLKREAADYAVRGFRDALAWYETNKDRFTIKIVNDPVINAVPIPETS